MARHAWMALCFALGCSEVRPASLPNGTEIASLDVDALALRFDEYDDALRAAVRRDDGAVGIRGRRAGHAAYVAYRRRHDPRFARHARRWLIDAATDPAQGGGQCLAALDLAELERSLGDDEAARRIVEAALGRGNGPVECRAGLRALASSLGTTSDATTFGSIGTAAQIEEVEVLGGNLEGAVSVRVVVSLDADARGELIAPALNDGVRRARLRFANATYRADLALPSDLDTSGLLRIERAPAGEAGLDFVVSEGVTVRAYAVEAPVRWIIDFDQGGPSEPSRVGPPRLIVIDPGHGGDEHGARVDGVRESHLVLDIAVRAAAALRRALPGTRVLLTRTSDDEISLEQRSSLANALDADLFVSIHLNDADVPVTTGGITTFVLDTDDDRQALRLAARENSTTTDRVRGLSVLLAGLHRETQVAGSRRLASHVHASVLRHARTVLPRIPDRGVRSDVFYVLVGTRMPAILVECSFMTRPEELAALRTEGYREQLGLGIADGVVSYVGSR